MEFSRWQNSLVVFIMLEAVIAGASFVLPEKEILHNKVAVVSVDQNKIDLQPKYVPPKKLENLPEIIKAVYATGYSAGSKKYLD